MEHFHATIPMLFDMPTDDILPGHIGPGLLLNLDGERELVPMQFGLAKIDAEEPFDRKYPNNNARIEKYNSWPWKLPFAEHRCILPLSEFREPCYWGDTAGTEVYFKATQGKYLGVAGVYNVWKSQGSEKFYTMTFLMRPASKCVMDCGHHRQPFFIAEEGFNKWMEPRKRDPKESLNILREYAHEPPLEYRIERHMAASWKGRQKTVLPIATSNLSQSMQLDRSDSSQRMMQTESPRSASGLCQSLRRSLRWGWAEPPRILFPRNMPGIAVTATKNQRGRSTPSPSG